MAFMVCHMEKFSEKDIQGIGIHNERKTENSKNEDIDYSRTPENTMAILLIGKSEKIL